MAVSAVESVAVKAVGVAKQFRIRTSRGARAICRGRMSPTSTAQLHARPSSQPVTPTPRWTLVSMRDVHPPCVVAASKQVRMAHPASSPLSVLAAGSGVRDGVSVVRGGAAWQHGEEETISPRIRVAAAGAARVAGDGGGCARASGDTRPRAASCDNGRDVDVKGRRKNLTGLSWADMSAFKVEGGQGLQLLNAIAANKVSMPHASDARKGGQEAGSTSGGDPDHESVLPVQGNVLM
ncbi:hypothetical protein C8J57DRAFT_1578943 [Mycena rebaudengoi]|nr:hypothetical protein C8J57DRAFT_1578943 [Mycena rebaudengoi]